MRAAVSITLVALLAGCPKTGEKKPVEPAAKRDAAVLLAPDDGSAAQLPPAPPLPAVPLGLPARPARPLVTPETVALGELLFHDARLSTTGKLSCAGCHVPAQGFSGTGRQLTATGKQNLRRAPALINIAWSMLLGWDGAYSSVESLLVTHVRGQLGQELGDALPGLANLPLYRAHFERVHALGLIGQATTVDAVNDELARVALSAYVMTRYSGGVRWDHLERDPAVPENLKAGYMLFRGKAQCATCHPPPLYTDMAFHRLGLIKLADEGRGRIEPAFAGTFRTPTLRDAARRTSFFHDGSATSLEAAVDWHLAGGTGQGADRSIIDPELDKIVLTPEERAALMAFVVGLTDTAPPPPPPALP